MNHLIEPEVAKTDMRLGSKLSQIHVLILRDFEALSQQEGLCSRLNASSKRDASCSSLVRKDAFMDQPGLRVRKMGVSA